MRVTMPFNLFFCRYYFNHRPIIVFVNMLFLPEKVKLDYKKLQVQTKHILRLERSLLSGLGRKKPLYNSKSNSKKSISKYALFFYDNI